MTSKVGNSQHAYQPLTSKHEIRLISLRPAGEPTDPVHCDLVHTDLSHPFPDYEAVSYTWLTEQDMTCGLYYDHINLDGSPRFAVTPSCHSALKRFRLACSARLLWIDAICIDQSNVVERSQQVTLMSYIYQSARRVLIWLGEESPQDEEAVQNIHKMHEFFERYAPDQQVLTQEALWEGQHDSNLYLPDPEDQAWVSICDLFWRRWFTRAWIIQEVAMAKEAVMYCGHLEIRWDILAQVARQLSKQNLFFFLRSTKMGGRAVVPSVALIDWIKSEVLAGPKRLKLMDTLVFSRWFQVTDTRDRVYSLLHFVEDVEQITPDYTIDPADLYSKVVADAITRSNSLDLLENVQGIPATENSGIPSWVGIWSMRSIPLSRLTILSHAETLKDPVFRFTTDHKTLVVQGRIIDTINDLASEFTNFNLDGRYSYKSARFKFSWDTINWTKEIESVAKNACKSKHLDRDAEEIVARVLCLNSMAPEQKATDATYRQFYHDWKSTHRMLMAHFEAGGGAFNCSEQLVHYQKKVQQYAAAVGEAANYRRFCSTRDGRFGLVPTMSKIDDIVCVLTGCKTPFIIRRRDSESFHYIGECYIDGLMEGEAPQGLPTSRRKFWTRNKKGKSETNAVVNQEILLK